MSALDDIRATDLPPRLAHLVSIIGLAATLRLIEARGGTRLYVPKRPDEDRLLVKLIGRPAAARLVRAYPGESLELDRGVRALRAVRDRALADDFETLSASKLALKYQLTERGVWKILNRARIVNTRQAAFRY